MKGLLLSRRFFELQGLAVFRNSLPHLYERVAVGLVGPGSECWGYDDVFSRDHDWGPAFCCWLTADDFHTYGEALQKKYVELPQTHEGFGPRVASPGEEGRVGVIETSAFYQQYTGLSHPPQTTEEWLRLPEQGAAVCTNGEVFRDPLQQFSNWRKALMAFYPEDIRRLKIASKCMTIAQSGQYNFKRSLLREEWVAVRYFETQFCAEIISLVFLLNRRFRPFYKWAHRALQELPILGKAIAAEMEELVRSMEEPFKVEMIETISRQIIAELYHQELSDSPSDFLLDHGSVVHQGITSGSLRGEYPFTRI